MSGEPAGFFPATRMRRLRRTAAMRRLVADVRLHPSDLLLPLFIKEELAEPEPIVSMPGVVQHSRESLRKAADAAVQAGGGGGVVFCLTGKKKGGGGGGRGPGGGGGGAAGGPRGEPRGGAEGVGGP